MSEQAGLDIEGSQFKSLNQKYVVNNTSGHLIVHELTCPSIQHQVNEKEYPRQDITTGLINKGRNLEGNIIYEEVRISSSSHYSAKIATLAEILKLQQNYRPCKICQPPINPHRPPRTRTIQSKSLGPQHIGRTYNEIGVLREIHITSEGITLIGSESDPIKVTPKTLLTYTPTYPSHKPGHLDEHSSE